MKKTKKYGKSFCTLAHAVKIAETSNPELQEYIGVPARLEGRGLYELLFIFENGESKEIKILSAQENDKEKRYTFGNCVFPDTCRVEIERLYV